MVIVFVSITVITTAIVAIRILVITTFYIFAFTARNAAAGTILIARKIPVVFILLSVLCLLLLVLPFVLLPLSVLSSLILPVLLLVPLL